MTHIPDFRPVFEARRKRLFARLPGRAVLLHNGGPRVRNIPASGYPFRADSHMLYFAGSYPAGAIALLTIDRAEVFLHRASIDEAVWDGAGRPWSEYETAFGVTALDRSELSARLAALGRDVVSSVPSLDRSANDELARLLGRAPDLSGVDRELALAMSETRLIQDELALSETRAAVVATESAFAAAMGVTRPGRSGHELLAELEYAGTRCGLTAAFTPIVTVEAEVLHSTETAGALPENALVLVDFGLETRFGFCSDVTRSWPIGGRFSAEQRAVYELVLAAQSAAIADVKIGALYGDIHLRACRVIAEGLVDIGLLRGSPDSLVERGAHTLFFPHGVGHLLGADVHDMEDLGDLAGYADGARRDTRFGFKFLRLNRRLRDGMLVTIEPGIYFIPAVLDNASFVEPFKDCIDVDSVAKFRKVRGVRIEDDVLVGAGGAEVLTQWIPKKVEDVEAAVGVSPFSPTSGKSR